MERLDFETTIPVVSLEEHRHRYLWAARYAQGRVCDVACGEGYGGAILCDGTAVTNYLGLDVSKEAIRRANTRYAGTGRSYEVGSALAIPLPDASIDTLVSLETLEHLDDPVRAMREYKRVMRPEAVLLGSVPSKCFDDRCAVVYGPNPFHLTRFTFETLLDLLSAHFRTVRVYYSALEIVSHIGRLEGGRPTASEEVILSRSGEIRGVDGSFLFVATDNPLEDFVTSHRNEARVCQALVEFEAEKVMPLRTALTNCERLVCAKDNALEKAGEFIWLRDEHLAKAAELIRERDALLRVANNKIAELSREGGE